MDRSEAELDAVLEFDRQPTVALVETDRFCDGCGYNLRTQPVRRDARTQLLLCRCPECGRFQPVRDGVTAGRVWLQRLGTLALFAWIITVLAVVFGLGAAQVGFTIIPLEKLTRYQRVAISTPPAWQSDGTDTQQTQSGLGPIVISGMRINITQGGTTTTWRQVVRESYPHYQAFMTLMHGISFALGFLLTLLAVVVFHHWRRWGYLVPAILVPAATGLLVWYIWYYDNPHLCDWATTKIVGQAAAHLAGGLTGILLGRPFARLLVTLMLPPKIRQVLAFLWLADGKQLPQVAAEP